MGINIGGQVLLWEIVDNAMVASQQSVIWMQETRVRLDARNEGQAYHLTLSF